MRYFLCLFALVGSTTFAADFDCMTLLIGGTRPGIEYASGYVAEDPAEALTVASRKEPESMKHHLLSAPLAQVVAWLHSTSYREMLVQHFNKSLISTAKRELEQETELIRFTTRLLVRQTDQSLQPFFAELQVVAADLRATPQNADMGFKLEIKLAAMSLTLPSLASVQADQLLKASGLDVLSPNSLTAEKVALTQVTLHDFFADDLRSSAESIKLFLVAELLHHALLEQRPLNAVALSYVQMLVDLAPEQLETRSPFEGSLARTAARVVFEKLAQRNLDLSVGSVIKIKALLQRLQRKIIL